MMIPHEYVVIIQQEKVATAGSLVRSRNLSLKKGLEPPPLIKGLGIIMHFGKISTSWMLVVQSIFGTPVPGSTTPIGGWAWFAMIAGVTGCDIQSMLASGPFNVLSLVSWSPNFLHPWLVLAAISFSLDSSSCILGG